MKTKFSMRNYPFLLKKCIKMRPISKIIAAFLMLVFTTADSFAQNNPYGDNYRNDKPSSSARSRPIRHCTESYANKLFNRDFGALGNSNMYHLANELQSYIKYKCCTSEQIRRLAGLFQTDRDKYEFLVYSLNYVYDIENYAMTGSVMANRNARDGFYRLLVREGIPAGDYYNDYYANVGYYNPPPVYVQPRQNTDNSYNTYPDPRNGNQNQTPQYNNGNYPNNGGFEPNSGGNNQNQAPQYNNSNNPNNGGFGQTNTGNSPNNGANGYTNNTYQRNDNTNPTVGSKGVNAGYQGLMTYKEFANMKDRIKTKYTRRWQIRSRQSYDTREHTNGGTSIGNYTIVYV
jgi:hypothetical protein